MKSEIHPQELTQVPFSKTECGVDFNINTDTHERLRGVLMEYPSFKTNFFELFFFRKASGWVRYGFQHIALKDNTVLILSPHIHQEWHIDESQMDYRFLVFRDDFLSTYLADPFFTYRLLYCYQTDFPPHLSATAMEQQEYERLLVRIKEELNHPLADSYHIIVSLLHYLLMTLNRRYSTQYHLPFDTPKNHHAFEFKQLLEKHIRQYQRVADYAAMLNISRITLNASVQAQYGQTSAHLLKQRLLAEIKNEILFTNKTTSELAYEFNFSEPGHLMRFFKKQTGQTVTEFKEEYKGGQFAAESKK